MTKNDVKEVQHQVDGGWDSPTDNGYTGEGIKTGTADDAVDMHRLGKKQELKRNFRSFSILGLSSVIMATWVAILGSASFSLINGGYAGTIWMYVGVWVFTFPVTLSLAEMASMYVQPSPTSIRHALISCSGLQRVAGSIIGLPNLHLLAARSS